MTKRARTVGTMNPTGTWPSFVVPIFSSIGGGNSLLLQVIGINGRTSAFTEYLSSSWSPFALMGDELIVEEGQPALHGFAFSDEELIVGTRADIGERVGALIDDPRLIAKPLLRLDAVEFAKKWDRFHEVGNAALEALGRVSPTSATRWRDGVYLTRQLRLAVANALDWTAEPLTFYDSLNSVSLIRSGGHSFVEIGADIEDSLEAAGRWRHVIRASVARSFNVFGIKANELQFRFVESEMTLPSMPPSLDEPGYLDNVEWVLFPIGERARRAMDGREFGWRRDLYIIESNEIRGFERLAKRFGKRKVQFAFIVDTDEQSQEVAIAASREAERFFSVSIALLLRSDSAPKPPAYWAAWKMGAGEFHVILDGHIEMFGPRTRFPVGRLVRAWLSHVQAIRIDSLQFRQMKGVMAFALGSHRGGVGAAPHALRQAVAGLANLHFNASSARHLDGQVTSVGRLEGDRRQELRSELSSILPEAVNSEFYWRQVPVQPHAVPVQVSLLIGGVEFQGEEFGGNPIADASELVLKAAGFSSLERRSDEVATYFRVGGHSPFTVIAAPRYDERIDRDPAGAIHAVASNKARRGFAAFLKEYEPILRFDELAFLQGADDPMGLACHMSAFRTSPSELRERYSDQIRADISDELLSRPERYDLYNALQDLSRNTRIENVDVIIERVIRQPGYRLRFEGALELAVVLDYDSDTTMRDHYPGSFAFELDYDESKLVRATADTSSFYQ